MNDLKTITEKTCEIALEAGTFIKNEVAGFDMGKAEVKGLNNFVSYVDKASEELIVRQLKSLLPEAGFITEEGTVKIEENKLMWVIDPLDGTTNFMHGCPPYAVSIGLREKGEDIAGAVYEIAAGEMFYAWKYGGAWLNGKQIRVSTVSKLSDSLVATGFPYSDFSRLDKYIELFRWFLKNSHGVRRLGSAATDIAYIACGRFEAFYEYGLHPWDISAASIILREAGGRITDFSGNSSNLDGSEIVAASEPVFLEILDIVSNFMKK